jgi:hypothetical protein
LYVTTVSTPVGWRLTIGYTLPANSQVQAVTLNGFPASFHIVKTDRGREVHVQTNSGGKQELAVRTE